MELEHHQDAQPHLEGRREQPHVNYKIKVGVVGAMDETLGSSLRADLVEGTSFSGAADAINDEAKRLREDEAATLSSASRTRSTPRPLPHSSMASMLWSQATSTST